MAKPDNNKLSDKQTITFELVKSYGFSNCMNCHSGQRSPDLTKLASVQAAKNDIWRSIETKKMPPASSGDPESTACQKELIQKWIDLGAPETSDVIVGSLPACKTDPIGNPEPTPEPNPEPPQVTPILLMPMNYNSLNERILKPKCLMCHVEKGEGEDYLFYPYKNLMLLDRMWKTPAIESKVYRSLVATDDDAMPPREGKIIIEPLTQEEIEFVRRWIDAGKPEK